MALTYTPQQTYDAATVYFSTNADLIEAQEMLDAYIANQTDMPPLSGEILMQQLKGMGTESSVVSAEFELTINSITARRNEVKPILLTFFTENPAVTNITLDDGSLELISSGGDIIVQVP